MRVSCDMASSSAAKDYSPLSALAIMSQLVSSVSIEAGFQGYAADQAPVYLAPVYINQPITTNSGCYRKRRVMLDPPLSIG